MLGVEVGVYRVCLESGPGHFVISRLNKSSLSGITESWELTAKERPNPPCGEVHYISTIKNIGDLEIHFLALPAQASTRQRVHHQLLLSCRLKLVNPYSAPPTAEVVRRNVRKVSLQPSLLDRGVSFSCNVCFRQSSHVFWISHIECIDRWFETRWIVQ